MNSQFGTQAVMGNSIILDLTTVLNLTALPLQMLQFRLTEQQNILAKIQTLQNMHAQATYAQTIPSALPIEPTKYFQVQPNWDFLLKEETDNQTIVPSISESQSSFSASGPYYGVQTPNIPFDTAFNGSYIQQHPREQIRLNAYFLKEIHEIVRFIISNMRKGNQTVIEAKRNQYLQNQTLLQIFDKLMAKYYSAKRSKEEMIKYIFRKVCKGIKGSSKPKDKAHGKKSSVFVDLQTYFQEKYQEIEEDEESEKELEIIEVANPSKKKTKTKAIDPVFIRKMFSSKEFCLEYQKFLEGFHNTMRQDNAQKIEKLVSFLVDCTKMNCLSRIEAFRRLPWLDV